MIGFDAVAPDFFWLAGQGGYGIQTAAGAAALAAAQLKRTAMPEVLVGFGVDPTMVTPMRLAGR